MKTVATNKKANYLYKIEEKIEAGIVLTGTEIKSIRSGGVSINEAYAKIYGGDPELYNMYIAPYEFGNIHNKDPKRARKLLLHKKQITNLIGKISEQGLTLVPIRLYFNQKSYLKIELGLGRGKNVHDKREDIKRKDDKRNIEKLLKKSLR
jgi:SsrA-binding protein